MNGVILLPSLNRPKLLERFVESYIKTKAEVEVRIIVDQEDWIKNTENYGPMQLPPTISFVVLDKVSMGDKVRAAISAIKLEKNAPLWVGLLNDDHICLTEHWDKKVEAMIDGSNMVSTFDNAWNFGFRVVGLTAWSWGLIEAVDFPIFPRNLQHLYIDDVWKAIGESTGCWRETTKINFEHAHVLKGAMEQDSTFLKVYAQSSNEYDRKEFQHFMEQDFKDVCMKIVELRKHHIQRAALE